MNGHTRRTSAVPRTSSGTVYMPPTKTYLGFDIYHGDSLPGTTWQDDFPYFQMAYKGGLYGVMMKASEGNSGVDPAFLGRMPVAQQAGLVVGAYHFFDAGVDPISQAKNFLAVTGGHFRWSILDFEPSSARPELDGDAVAFIQTVEASTGQPCMLYTCRWDVVPGDAADGFLQQRPFWLAEYGMQPIPPDGWSDWTFWQCTDGNIGSSVIPVPGIGNVDRSWYAGTPQQFVDTYGGM